MIQSRLPSILHFESLKTTIFISCSQERNFIKFEICNILRCYYMERAYQHTWMISHRSSCRIWAFNIFQQQQKILGPFIMYKAFSFSWHILFWPKSWSAFNQSNILELKGPLPNYSKILGHIHKGKSMSTKCLTREKKKG